MTLRQYLLIMSLATLLCWVAFILVIQNIDPFQSNILGFLFFYTSLFLSLLGTGSITLFSVFQIRSKKSDPLFVDVQKSFYYACLGAGTLVLMLFLQAVQLLNVLNAVIIGVLFVLVILFIFSINRGNSEKSPQMN